MCLLDGRVLLFLWDCFTAGRFGGFEGFGVLVVGSIDWTGAGKLPLSAQHLGFFRSFLKYAVAFSSRVFHWKTGNIFGEQ